MQVLPPLRQELQHLADGRDEPHVEHAVRLVENEVTHRAKVDGALAGKIEKPPGCRDQEIATAAQ